MDADANANANADAGGSTIALRELCSGELKMKAEQTAILCKERSKCAPVLSVRESVITFH